MSNRMHVGPKEKEQINLAAGLFVVMSNEERSSDDLWETGFQ
jgi:hypothetical protein